MRPPWQAIATANESLSGAGIPRVDDQGLKRARAGLAYFRRRGKVVVPFAISYNIDIHVLQRQALDVNFLAQQWPPPTSASVADTIFDSLFLSVTSISVACGIGKRPMDTLPLTATISPVASEATVSNSDLVSTRDSKHRHCHKEHEWRKYDQCHI